jgi:hypothetical protein
MGEKRRVLEEIEHDRLVIALEEMRVEPSRQPSEQEIDYFSAVRPPVDVVAKENKRPPLCPFSSRHIRSDLGQQRREQVGPAVNIADGVNELALRQGWMIQGGETDRASVVHRPFYPRPQVQSALNPHAFPVALRIS